MECSFIVRRHKLDLRNPPDFSLSRTSVEFLTKQYLYFPDRFFREPFFMNLIHVAVRQEVSNLERSVVVQALELTINLASAWPFMKFRFRSVFIGFCAAQSLFQCIKNNVLKIM